MNSFMQTPTVETTISITNDGALVTALNKKDDLRLQKLDCRLTILENANPVLVAEAKTTLANLIAEEAKL